MLLLFFISCKKNNGKHPFSEKNTDSIEYYYQRVLNQNLPDKEKNKSIFRAYDLLQTADNNNENRKKIAKLTFDFYYIDDIKMFDKSSRFLLSLSEEEKDTANLGKAYRCRAIFYNGEKKLDSSFYFFKKAEKIYTALNDKETLSTILMNKGIIQFSLGEFLGAELSLNKAYNYFKQENNYQKQYLILNQLGLVSTELKEYDKALFYHYQALKAAQSIENKSSEVNTCYGNIGYLFIRQKKYKEAISSLKKGLENQNLKNIDPVLYANLIDNQAYAQLQISDFQNLPQMFFEALEIRKKHDNLTSVIGSYTHISEYYKKSNNNIKAIEFSNEALYEARKSKIANNILIALKQAQEVDKEKIPIYTEEYLRLNDSLQIAERNSKDRLSRIELETDEIIKEKDKLEEQNRTLLYLSLVVGVILTLLFILRAQRARTRELLYKQAQQKANEEIFNLMMSQQNVIDESRKEEKHRIARDLHDGVLGRMFGVRLNLDSLNYRNDAESTEKRHQYINELKDIEQDIREISHDLNREKQALINNFISIINKLLEEQSHLFSTNLKYYIDDKIIWDKINNTSKINLYRILQESLQNINKYAEAKHIFVELKKENDNIVLNIEDDGLGFDVTKKSKGIGVQNMISRTDECHGIIDITSKKGHGTKISIKIPIEINTTNII